MNSALIRSKMVVADFSTIDLSIVLFIIGKSNTFCKGNILLKSMHNLTW